MRRVTARPAALRKDGRRPDELRPVRIERGYVKHAEGSVLIETGDTRVVCTASVEQRVPSWRRESGSGWVTAEYGMLPRSAATRMSREAYGSVRGRTQEIQRLIGRSLRAVTDMAALGPRTVTIDCDVLQADGGTRSASITGAFVAFHDALAGLVASGALPALPLRDFVAAVSVGIVDGRTLLDLPYEEDSRAQVDLNLVMTRTGDLVEVQGTAEGIPFSIPELSGMIRLGRAGIERLVRCQEDSLGVAGPRRKAAPSRRRARSTPAR